MFPPLDFLACADGRTVADDDWLNPGTPYFLRQVYGMLPLLGFLACADGRIVADHVWPQLGGPHFLPHVHGLA